MATINEVLERVSRTKPSGMDDTDKARILVELDNRIYQEITAEDEPNRMPPKEWPEDEDEELIVRAPYDNLYDFYLTAMIEYWMREYGNYNNSAALFQEAYNEFRSRWRRDHTPAKRPGFQVMR